MRLKLSIVLVGSLIFGPTAYAGVSVKPTPVSSGSIEIDGDGEDPGWSLAPWITGFVQQDPDEGSPPTEETRVKAAYDDSAVYFWVYARDSRPQDIAGWLTRRDELSASDWIHLWLDTYDDARTAYRFSANPVGVKQDARLVDAEEDLDWNGVWDVRTRTSSSGWTAEFRIPFAQLHYDNAHPRWGFQIGRDLRRLSEKSYLSSTPRGATQLASHFGTLEGLRVLPATGALTIEPYFTAGVQRLEGNSSLTGNIGGQIGFDLASELNLILTINPDFGQFEADPSVLNLNATEVFFDERRSFFLEGREQLSFPLEFGDLARNTLFYTRRIGRAPVGFGRLAENESFRSYPSTTPIISAVKLTGKTNDGWAIGALDALTADAFAELDGPPREGSSNERLVEPLANAALLRVSKDFREGQTTAGLMATHLVRRLTPDTRHEFLAHAISGGGDFSHRVGDYQFVGRALGTHLTGSPEAIEAVQASPVHYFQRPDADHVELDPSKTSLFGYGLMMVAGKLSGTDWRGAAGLNLYSPGADANPLGYLARADQQTAWLWGQYREDAPGWLHRRFDFNINSYATQTYGSELTELGGNLAANWTFDNQYELYFGAGRDFEHLDVLSLFGGPGLLLPGRWYGWLGLASDENSSWVFGVDARGEVGTFGPRLTLTLSLKFRPTSALELSLVPGVSRGTFDSQFVEQVEDDYLVGHLDQWTTDLTARADWTLNPQMSLQLYASPFISAGTFRDFRRVSDPRAENYRDRFQPISYEGQDRFLFAQFRSNVVYRWEYMPGSTLFLVWSHEQNIDRSERGVIRLQNDLGNLFGAPSNDTVMMKLNHWFTL